METSQLQQCLPMFLHNALLWVSVCVPIYRRKAEKKAPMFKYRRISLGVIIWYFFLCQQNLELPQICGLSVPSQQSVFHLMERALSQIRHQLVILTRFALPSFQHIFQAGQIIDQGFVVKSMFTFLFWQPTECLPNHRHQNMGVKFVCRYQLVLSMFSELCSEYCLQQWGLVVSV